MSGTYVSAINMPGNEDPEVDTQESTNKDDDNETTEEQQQPEQDDYEARVDGALTGVMDSEEEDESS